MQSYNSVRGLESWKDGWMRLKHVVIVVPQWSIRKPHIWLYITDYRLWNAAWFNSGQWSKRNVRFIHCAAQTRWAVIQVWMGRVKKKLLHQKTTCVCKWEPDRLSLFQSMFWTLSIIEHSLPHPSPPTARNETVCHCGVTPLMLQCTCWYLYKNEKNCP